MRSIDLEQHDRKHHHSMILSYGARSLIEVATEILLNSFIGRIE